MSLTAERARRRECVSALKCMQAAPPASQPSAVPGHSAAAPACRSSKPLRFVELNTGQRVSVLVCPDPAAPGGYRPGAPAWVRAHMIQEVFPSPAPSPTVLGVLQYSGPTARPHTLPTTQPYEYSDAEASQCR